jgi:hypothetical protein
VKDYDAEYERLKKDTAEWCSINMINIGDKTKQAVGRKQWVVSRLFDTKRDLIKLQKEKVKLKQAVIDKLIQNSPVNLDKSTLAAIDNSPQLEVINEQIKDCEFLVAYLEYSVKMYAYIAQDIKNMLESHKLMTEDHGV